MSLTLNFLGGAPFQLLYDGVRIAIGRSSKFKTVLQNLESTLDCLQPRIIQQIRDRNVELNLPTEVIQDVQVKMGEGIELVARLSRLSMWNIRVWGNCCNCIKPDYSDQLDQLDRSLRRLLEILKLEQMRNVMELLDVARRTFDKLDEVQRGQSDILKALQEIPGEILRAQQDIIQRIEGNGVQQVANAPPPPAHALGIAFRMLFDAVMQAKVKNVKYERLLGEFKHTVECLKPFIEEIAAYNKLLHLPKQDVENYIIEMDKGVELVHKCSQARKYKNTNKLLKLDESLQRLFIDLKGQVERNVKEAMDLTSNIEAVIKKIGGRGVLQDDEIESALPVRSPTVGLDALNMQGARDVIEETLDSTRNIERIEFVDSTTNVHGTTDVIEETFDFTRNIEGIEVKKTEGSGVVQNRTEIAAAETEPPSPTVQLDVMETLDSARNVGMGVNRIEESSVAPNQCEPPSLTVGLEVMSMPGITRDVETMDFARNMEVVKRKEEQEQKKEENKVKVSIESFPKQSGFEVDESKDMEGRLDDAGPAEKEPSNTSLWPSDFAESFQSVSLSSQEETLSNKELPESLDQDVFSSLKASQVLWRGGMLVEPIPDGFYFVIPKKWFKQRFDDIPTLDELHALEAEGFKADIILVDSAKDKKLFMLKQLIMAQVRGLNSNAVGMIKKVANLVSDFYKQPAKATSSPEDRGVQLLGNTRHGSCCPRAILFKVLADTVGLESRLMVNLPKDVAIGSVDSCNKHVSVIVVLNSVELLVDLMRFPGQLLPLSNKAVLMVHNYASGESDSAEYDSCRSPLELNYSQSSDSTEKDESLPLRVRFDAASNIPHNELIAEMWTASSSSENASFPGARRQSMLDGGRKSSNSSHGALISLEEAQRSRSIAPEIGDEIERAIDQRLLQTRILISDFERNDQISSQKAVCGPAEFMRNDEPVSTWNRILESATSNEKLALFPYKEWNIDFSDLTVGIRIGVGFFGETFRGTWNGTDVAIKVFSEQDLTAETVADNEISILSRIRHPNVILFLGACTMPPRLSLVTEYMEMGSLYYLIHLSDQKKKLTWRRRLKMLRDICRGLMGIHRMKVVHCDLKSANCLVNKHWTVKICDFGLSRMMTETNMKDSSSLSAGTPQWMAPELIRKEPFTEKCDIFSFGVIMWEMCTLNRPWEGVPPERVRYAVANEGSRLGIPDGQLGNLISDCWTEQPHLRPTCNEILSRLLDSNYSLCRYK